jgi:hypothetical protein
MAHRTQMRLGGLLLAAAASIAGCGDSDSDGDAGTSGDGANGDAAVIDPGDDGRYSPEVDPADFVDGIDNPYLPYRPGARWVYEVQTEDGETEVVTVEVLDERREVMGVTTVVVHDVVSVEGEVIEDTYDWYAQDLDGNVWYFGEDTTEYDDGDASTEGSWEAGVDGALPGIVMQAAPAVSELGYRQEYLAGEAEDMGRVVRVGETVELAIGTYTDVVVTIDWTPLEPDVVEEKYYAPGVGLVQEVKTTGPAETEVLVEFDPGS